MEGVLDALLRAVLAETGGFDFAVSEFVRVSQGPLSAATIARRIPEIAGIRIGLKMLPTQVQLLGSDPELLAQTALEACAAGARAIDLNFGCPSPTVIRHHGGSALLKEPAQIQRIVSAVRKTVPTPIPVSAKIRLGFTAPAEVFTIAQAVADGGADWLVIHARTRAEFYRPGVHWQPVSEVCRALSIPVVANGDLFSVEDLVRCEKQTGCGHFMFGRGALLDPFIAHRARAHLKLSPEPGVLGPAPADPLSGLVGAIQRFVELGEPLAENRGYVPSRLKQWLRISRAFELGLIPRGLQSLIAHSKTGHEILERLGEFKSAETRTRA